MGKAEDERLQRYFDGELAPAERAEVEAALTEDDRLKLAALGELRGLVGNALQAEAADIDLWPALESKLGLGGATAADLAGAGSSGKAAAKARRRWGLRAHPASWSAGLVSMAAAAALLLFVQPWHSGHPQNGCDIESLETQGAVATVFDIDGAHRGDEGTTVIWTTEED
jgi:anti-sigma factor RsiW